MSKYQEDEQYNEYLKNKKDCCEKQDCCKEALLNKKIDHVIKLLTEINDLLSG